MASWSTMYTSTPTVTMFTRHSYRNGRPRGECLAAGHGAAGVEEGLRRLGSVQHLDLGQMQVVGAEQPHPHEAVPAADGERAPGRRRARHVGPRDPRDAVVGALDHEVRQPSYAAVGPVVDH